MPWEGNTGVFRRLYSWVSDAASNIDIFADRMDNDTNDIVQNGVMNAIQRDGRIPATANLPMAGFRHLVCADAQNPDEYLTLNQFQSGTIPGGAYLPLTDGTIYRAGGSNPLQIQADSAADACIIFNVSGVRSWQFGARDTDGLFVVYDLTASAYRFWIDGSGAATIAGALNVNGAASFSGAATVNGRLTCGDFQSNGNVWAPNGWGNFAGGLTSGSYLNVAGTTTTQELTVNDRAAILEIDLGASQSSRQGWFDGTNGNGLLNGNFTVGGSCTVGSNFQCNAPANGGVYVPNGYVWAGNYVYGAQLHAGGNGLQVDGAGTVNGNFSVGGYCTVADFRSNANVYVPNGYVSAGTTITAGGTIQSNGNRVLAVGGNAPSVTCSNTGGGTFGMWSASGFLEWGTCNGDGSPAATWMYLDGGANLHLGLGGYNCPNNTSSFFGTAQIQILVVQGDTHMHGNLVVDGVFSNPSDRRLKEVVEPFCRGLDAVRELRPASWCWNGKGGMARDGRRYYGLVADELERVIPEAIGRRRVQLDPSDPAPVDIATVNDKPVLMAVINAIAELATRLERLERRVYDPPGAGG